MSDEKDLQQQKKEAAERAKQLARERIAAKKAAEQTEQTLEETSAHSEKETSEQEDDLELAKKKAAAAAKAKAAALAKQRAKEAEQTESSVGSEDDLDLAKKKAAAAAKAKAAALAKQKAKETANEETDDDIAKQKAIAAAKAKAAAAAKAKAEALAKQQEGSGTAASDDEIAKAKAKAIAAAKAKAAAAAKAKAANAGGAESPEREETPSPNQPLLDKYVKVIKEHLGDDVLEDAYINRLSKDVPTLVAKKDTYYKIAEFLKYNEQLGFDYLSELHGTDFETHMEVYVHLYSYKNHQSVALKVKLDRDHPEIDSLVPLWQGANWPECEAYDLLGIRFRGHPNLIRIFLGENWIGHPLRKDYEPYDVEV
ncbi:NADH-quinone oxidoreductase subunit C [Thermaerobacillus caldiproteolyticus]|uniref:NADH-quinone oxidoreductase subunit C n=1 Tax=Thermaerobacillus caldiproteolyticus TaxID=247480 RepID=UPI0018F21569|nr:NADH-quinone oxidoreductase subunit C [Anoxybacillus caldiproteolyticus]